MSIYSLIILGVFGGWWFRCLVIRIVGKPCWIAKENTIIPWAVNFNVRDCDFTLGHS